MAFVELGLTETEFYILPPYRTYMMQMHSRRMNEKQWEQTRFIATMQHNTAPGKKRQITPRQLVRLSLDDRVKSPYPEWSQQDAEDLIRLWPDIPKKN